MITVSFSLNGTPVSFDTEPDIRLSDLLRERFGLLSVKCGCRSGFCGSCIVLLDGKPANSCLVPAFNLLGRSIITWEGFKDTDACKNIEEGFAEAGCKPCGYCTKAKLLTAHRLIECNRDPSSKEIITAFSSITCRCTDPETLKAGILAAAAKRKKGIYARSD